MGGLSRAWYASRNALLIWLLGGDIKHVFKTSEARVPGESVPVIRDRTEILTTVVGRILCDNN